MLAGIEMCKTFLPENPGSAQQQQHAHRVQIGLRAEGRGRRLVDQGVRRVDGLPGIAGILDQWQGHRRRLGRASGQLELWDGATGTNTDRPGIDIDQCAVDVTETRGRGGQGAAGTGIQTIIVAVGSLDHVAGPVPEGKYMAGGGGMGGGFVALHAHGRLRGLLGGGRIHMSGFDCTGQVLGGRCVRTLACRLIHVSALCGWIYRREGHGGYLFPSPDAAVLATCIGENVIHGLLICRPWKDFVKAIGGLIGNFRVNLPGILSQGLGGSMNHHLWHHLQPGRDGRWPG